ncbi:MAG TPA: hypothetical protein VEK39_08185 [Solirubrobacterales bacterium]|nr:hypothetical protein [Solirubrobacterales bacterium]
MGAAFLTDTVGFLVARVWVGRRRQRRVDADDRQDDATPSDISGSGAAVSMRSERLPDRRARILAPYWSLPVWRSPESWRRGDSLLLVGLLALVDYLLIAIVIFATFGLVADSAVSLLAVEIFALALAETLCAVRPTHERLARADHLVLVAFGTFMALGVLGGLVMLVEAL